MKVGTFNIHDYIGKLYENTSEENFFLNEEQTSDGKLPDSEGIIIPDINKKAYDWLKKEYNKGKTEVKVEMSSHEFKPGYNLETSQKSIKDFKPGMYGQVKTSDNEKGKRETSVPFPETKFPGSETKLTDDNKIKEQTIKDKTNKEDKDNKEVKEENKDKKSFIPKVEVKSKK